MKKLTPQSASDNFLLEMELALKYNAKNTMAIYPLLVGSTAVDAQGQKTYTRFDSTLFKMEGIPKTRSPTSPISPYDTLKSMFKFQGIKMMKPTLTTEELNDVVKWLDDFAWNKTSADSMQVGDDDHMV